MSRVYFVRHGQAGTREAYDTLSAVGRRQARLLGEHFVDEGIHFAAAYSGALMRQQETGAEVRAAYRKAGVCFPEIALQPSWNEFDLAHVYSALAPLLCAEDPEFAREYEHMAAQARAAAKDPDASVNRRWFPCDVKIIQAWIRGQHPYEGESWEAFRERVAGGNLNLLRADGEANVIVFTSATPIGIWTALSMEVHDGRALRLAGALYNASCTVLRFNDAGEPRLHSFNAVPHLREADLRTYR